MLVPGPRGGLVPCGPGCVLGRVLSWFGVRDDGKCGCAEFAAKMDEWGPDECARREDEIVAHLAAAAEKRSVLFHEAAARACVRFAIWRSR